MIVDDEEDVDGLEDIIADLDDGLVDLERGLSFQQLLTGTHEIESSDMHFSLKGDLIEHLWALKGATST